MSLQAHDAKFPPCRKERERTDWIREKARFKTSSLKFEDPRRWGDKEPSYEDTRV